MRRQHADRTEQEPWYAEGLRFGCIACGLCCGGAPGYVWIDEADLVALARRLRLSTKEFRKKYVRRLWRGMSLKEKPNYDCVLLNSEGRCIAYEERPTQCRTWPFWPSNLKNPEAWHEAGKRCPGIGEGPLYRLEQIESLRMEMEL